MAGFLIRVTLSITIPIVVIGAVLWWFVSRDAVDRTLDAQAASLAGLVDSVVAPSIEAGPDDRGDTVVRVTDPDAIASAVDTFVAPVVTTPSGVVGARIVDPVGRIVWPAAGADASGVSTIDDLRRVALGGVPGGSLGPEGRTLTGEATQPTRYAVPLAVDGRTVAVLDLDVSDDAAVGAAVANGRSLAWLFGGAFLALVIALVPLGWTSLGSVRRNMRRTRTQAMSDNLTGLANRTQFHMRLDEALAGAQRNATRVGLLLLDLDGFKAINDTGGHAAGDRLLRRVAAGLGEVTRRNELACRLGGDEFAVVVPRVGDREELRGLADRLHEKLDLPVSFADGRTLRVTASIGVALYPDDARSSDDLVTVADAAMYQVKLARKSQLPAALRSQAVR